MNLNQVTVPAKDVAVSVEFYKKLGLQLIVDSIPRPGIQNARNGESNQLLIAVWLSLNIPKLKTPILNLG